MEAESRLLALAVILLSAGFTLVLRRPNPKRCFSPAVARAAGAHRRPGARGRRALAADRTARRWLCPGVLLGVYEPRASAGTVLHQVVGAHLERFVAETAAATDGAGAALSSSGSSVTSSAAAHLVDAVLPSVPVRQWVLTVPHRLRYRLAFDHTLCRAVVRVFIRAVLGWYRRRGRRAGREGQSGTVTVVQRFGSGLELNVHFHALGLDGVFAPGADGTLRFHRLPPPSDADVARLVATIARRVERLLVRRGLVDDTDSIDQLTAESLALAGLASAAVQGRIALGPRAGARVMWLFSRLTAALARRETSPALQAHVPRRRVAGAEVSGW